MERRMVWRRWLERWQRGYGWRRRCNCGRWQWRSCGRQRQHSYGQWRRRRAVATVVQRRREQRRGGGEIVDGTVDKGGVGGQRRRMVEDEQGRKKEEKSNCRGFI
jgi:hypothetical protein